MPSAAQGVTHAILTSSHAGAPGANGEQQERD